MDVSTPPRLDLACPQAEAEIEKYVLMSVFYFIDTSISKHVDIFLDIGFRLRTSEV